MEKANRKKKLATLIERMQADELGSAELKLLVCQFILGLPADEATSRSMPSARLTLDALKLLADVVKNDTEATQGGDLLDILRSTDAGEDGA